MSALISPNQVFTRTCESSLHKRHFSTYAEIVTRPNALSTYPWNSSKFPNTMKSANLILIFGFTPRVAFGYLHGRRHVGSGIRGLEELATSPGPSILVRSPAQAHSTSLVPVVMSTAPTTAETASPVLPLETTTSGSTQEAIRPVSSSTLCPDDTYFPRNFSIARYVGLSVANQIPCMTNNSAAPCPYQNVTEWNATFANIKAKFPSVNAVRLYSAIDFVGEDAQVHLHEALSAIRSHNLKIVAGLWSGGSTLR